MTLDNNVMKHLNENLSKSYDGGLHVISEGADLIDAPILIVGLGGTGLDSVIRTKHMVNMRLNRSTELPQNIEYLVFDTEEKSKNISYKGTRFSEKDEEVIIMTDAHLESTYNNLREETSPHITSWISRDLNVRQIQNGAGGIRQAGRFLFFNQIGKISAAIERKLKKITAGKKSTENKIYVFIAAGISGGTGSGTFIDMPYIIRHFSDTLGFNSQILGFVFLPDVNLPVVDGNLAASDNIRRNGFAALKELDYLMKLGKGGNNEYFSQSYGSFSVKYDRPPYDLCHLVSSINYAGINNFTKDNCMDVAAETIINFIANETLDEGTDYSISSYLSNIDSNTTSYTAKISEIKHPVAYNYLAIGSSIATLPLDNVLNYLTHLIFKRMHELYSKTPNEEEVRDAIIRLSLDFDGIRRRISNEAFTDPGISRYTYDIIKQNPSIVEEALSERFTKLKTVLRQNKDYFVEDFKKNSISYFNEIFKDLSKGPYYVSKLINPEILNNHIRNILNGDIVADRVSNIDLSTKETKTKELLSKIVNNSPLLGLGKASAENNYKNACIDFYGDLLDNAILDFSGEALEEIYTFLNDYNNKIFSVYTALIDALKDIFSEYADIKNTGVTETDKSTTVFTWNIISQSALTEQVELLINSDPALKTDFDKIAEGFLNRLINDSSKWLDSSNIIIAELLNNFVLENFQLLARRSIDFYMEKASQSDQDLQNKISEVIHRLNEGSEIMFPIVSSSAGKNDFPVFQYASVPCDTKNFNDIVQNGMIKRSVITNRISMLKVTHALPLVAYRELQAYESVYEKFAGQAGTGMHLYESPVKSWSNLPSPIYEGAWYNNYVNLRQQKENKNVSRVFDEALLYGYIKKGDYKNAYMCFYGDTINVNVALDEAGIKDINGSISIPEAVTAIGVLNQKLADTVRLTKTMQLYDVKFIDNEPDLTYSKGILRNMPELYRNVKIMVDNHNDVLEVIDRLKSIQGNVKYYNQFAQLVFTGIIHTYRGKYVYSAQKDEVLYAPPADISDLFMEYYAFEAFVALSSGLKDELFSRAVRLTDEADDETYETYKENVRKQIKIYTDQYQKIAREYSFVADGDKKVDFYSMMKKSLEDQLVRMEM